MLLRLAEALDAYASMLIDGNAVVFRPFVESQSSSDKISREDADRRKRAFEVIAAKRMEQRSRKNGYVEESSRLMRKLIGRLDSASDSIGKKGKRRIRDKVKRRLERKKEDRRERHLKRCSFRSTR